MGEAAAGDTQALEKLLASPSDNAAMRAAIQKWLIANPRLGDAPQPPKSLAGRPGVMSTGTHDVTCQAYNGQYMAWNGKAFLACHGYLDTYISGSHAGHYIPDLFPRGKALSISCTKALGGAGLLALGTATSAPTGPLGWAAVGSAWVWTVSDVIISCKHG